MEINQLIEVMTEAKPHGKRTFMLEHELEDAEASYIDAVYRFRKAEMTMAKSYDSCRREMNRLERLIQDLKYQIYSKSWK